MESRDFQSEGFIQTQDFDLICQCLRFHRKWTLFQNRGKWGLVFLQIMDFYDLDVISSTDINIFSTRPELYIVLLVIL